MESGEDRSDPVFTGLISFVQSVDDSSLLVLLGQSGANLRSPADLSNGDVGKFSQF